MSKIVECTDYAAMLRRMMSAYGRRVAGADVEDLAEMIDLSRHLDAVITATITEMRTHQEFSWRAIGEAAGVTRQAAQQRWGH